MRKPRALGPGAVVRLVTPASPLDAAKTMAMQNLLEGWGYKVEFGTHALTCGDYLAGIDLERAADLTDAFLDPTVDAIICTRGGYGCARLLPYLDIPLLAASGKLFLGFSDITTLHLPLNAYGLPTAHAPMALTFNTPREPWVYESFRRVLTGEAAVPEDAPTGVTLVPGFARGVVTGGCLVLMTDAIGTPFPVQAKGKIVLIEDVDEPPHRVDAMLTHFLNAGVLDGAVGIVVGEMTRSESKVDETIGGTDWREIVRERLSPLGIPTIIDYPFGHAKQMLTLPLGIEAELDADAGTLTYTEPLCI